MSSERRRKENQIQGVELPSMHILECMTSFDPCIFNVELSREFRQETGGIGLICCFIRGIVRSFASDQILMQQALRSADDTDFRSGTNKAALTDIL